MIGCLRLYLTGGKCSNGGFGMKVARIWGGISMTAGPEFPPRDAWPRGVCFLPDILCSTSSGESVLVQQQQHNQLDFTPCALLSCSRRGTVFVVAVGASLEIRDRCIIRIFHQNMCFTVVLG